MGIIFVRDGKPSVYEAISKVSSTPLNAWIKRGLQGHFVVKRLKNADTVLSTSSTVALAREARAFEGRPYDLTFEWSDDEIYCSELVWKIYDRALGIRLGMPQQLKEFELNDPAVKQKMAERYKNGPPLDETVISPQSIFDSPLLTTIESR